MKAKDIMTKDPVTCSPETTLAEAAHLMWDADCGILPVVDDGELVGVVTDRDMYIALATRNELAAHLKVGAVATKTPVSCAPEDEVHDILASMKHAAVRRLPVVGFGGKVLGIISVNDIVLAGDAKHRVPRDEILGVLRTICAHHQPVPHVVTT